MASAVAINTNRLTLIGLFIHLMIHSFTSFQQTFNVLQRKKKSENVRTTCSLEIKPKGSVHPQN